MSAISTELTSAIDDVLAAFASVPTVGLGAYLRVQACLIALVSLEDICSHPDRDPYPLLLSTLANSARLPAAFADSLSHVCLAAPAPVGIPDGVGRTADLFEAAWTHYDDKTYDHSLSLVEGRLAASGFDKKYFAGKTCFDGGCGTGRLSIAMARAGAKEVVAADIGGESLEYLKRTCARFGFTNIRIVEMDVTNLKEIVSDSFDFVASNGSHCIIRAATRIAESSSTSVSRVLNGIFWIYLLRSLTASIGSTFDRLKALVVDLQPRTTREILSNISIRQGLIYTYLR